MSEGPGSAAAAGFRLSPQQRALWPAQVASPHLGGRCVIDISGPLDPALLREVVREVVDRQEILRTTFPRQAGMRHPVQAIADRGEPLWAAADLRDSAPEELSRRAAELFETVAHFDLGRGPLARMMLLSLGLDRHALVVTLPALCADARTFKILNREIALGYTARVHGGEPPSSIQYADFAEWQHQLLEDEEEESALEARSYWRQVQTSSRPLLPPLGRTGPVATWSPHAVSWSLEPSVAATIEGLAEGAESSAGDFFLAAWQALLYRFSGEEDFLIGLAVDGRRFEQLQGTLGPCTRRVPMRCRPAAGRTFEELLREAAESSLAAAENQEHFALEEPADGEAALPVGFECDEESSTVDAGPLLFTLGRLRCFDQPCALQLSCHRHGSGFELQVIYDRAAVEPATALQLGDSLLCLVRAAARAPHTLLADLPVLGEAARHRVAVEWNDTGATDPEGESAALTLFERWAAARPAAPALSSDGAEVSYGELDRRANRLAHHLRDLGIGRESRVAVRLERTPEMVVALLAIWKAGGAYVAIDPELPAARQELLLELSAACLLITEERRGTAVHPVPPDLRVVRVLMDELPCPWDAMPDSGLAGRAGLDDLAYVAFTSGSTGVPKGVMALHRGVANYLQYLRSTFQLAPGERVLQLASLVFDAAVRDLIGPLTAGATVHLVPAARAKDPAALVSIVRQAGIDRLLSVVPPLLRALAEAAGAAGDGGSLRQVLVSGERLFGADCRAARQAFGDALEIVNQYGPTECTMTSSFLRAPADIDGGVVSLGRPIRNARFYVVDETLACVPPGVFGELYIGGSGLARGYLGQPDLTAERFVPDFLSGRCAERLYRTGDRVRLLSDGTLEFGGRLDHQVKVRGLRVELGEIETALREHPQVRDAVVAAREDEPGAVRLVAYLVFADTAVPSAEDLRRSLGRVLPEPMIPSAFVSLDALPSTPNGKVDRRALPDPVEAAPGAGRTGLSPRTPTEEIVAGLCAEVLGREQVGVDENFFELGGYSLLAAQLLARLCRACAVQIPLQVVFEVPTLAELAARVDQARLQGDHPAPPPIQPVPRHGPLPLSFAQQRLLILAQIEPASAAYNMPLAVRVAGPLDLGALWRSCDEIVRRHEVLRTTFRADAGGLAQVVAPAAPLPREVIDLAGLPEPERTAELRRLALREAFTPFDLARGPVLRARLLRLAPDDHAVLLTLHHIAGDDWSVGLLGKEIASLYSAALSGGEARLPHLPVQYADFAVWQRDWMRGASLARHLGYWRAQLDKVPGVLDLPFDRPRTSSPRSRGASRPFRLAAPLTAAVRAFSRREGTTLFMMLLSAFAGLLGRYSGQEDLAIGTPVAGRSRLEVENLIGCFINTLVLRADLTGDPEVPELLARVRAMVLAAQTHQDLPFERLVEELQPERDLGRTPLVQVMLTLLNAPRPSLEIPGLACTALGVEDQRLKLDVEFLLQEGEGALAGALLYDPALFDATTTERMLAHFERFLGSLITAPQRRLSAHSMLGESELQQLLWEWNDTEETGWRETLCLDLLTAQAERTPAAPAVADGRGELTYGELAAKVGRRAARLAELGVRRGDVVALLAERGCEWLATVIAVLAAGGVYLPLDPQHPPARLRRVLALSGATLAVAGTAVLHRLAMPDGMCPRLVSLEELAQARDGEAAPLRSELRPDDLAYIIYTSGSTGVPKGAMVEHRGMVNHLLLKIRDLGLGSGDTVAQTASATFDISVWQSLAALLVGGRVWIFDAETAQDPLRLSRQADHLGVTVLEVVPSLLQAMVADESGERPGLNRLRWMVPTGEALSPEVCRQWLRLYPRVPLLNAYGPTECSDDVTHHPLRSAPPAERSQVPIGRPVANLRLYVLGPGGQPQPPGVPGELLVGGTGVGRGYLGDSPRTAEAWVPDPFAGRPGERLYRTGDLARIRPDGEIEFLGRIDHQVKIRGYRIEVGEIEEALAQHPEIRQAAVVAREDSPGDRRLVAYLVPRAPTAMADWPAPRLRGFLADRLPAYMLPAAYVFLDRMPLTASGKVDRRSLPVPEPAEGGMPPGEADLRSPLEELLAGLWQGLLGAGAVGRDDDFFALGGHSLLATQLISRIRGIFGIELPLRALFEAPTPARLADRIEACRADGLAVPAPPLVPVPRSGPLALSFAQQRLWFLHQLDPESPAYNVAQAIRLTGHLRIDVLRRALAEVVRRHESLRTTFAVVGGRPWQRIEGFRPCAIPLRDLTALPAEVRQGELARLVAEDAVVPFNLERGPLLRISLLALAPREHVLLSCMHHIVSDAWSNEILIREMATLYTAFAAGEPAPLPDLPIQYADFAHWQRAWLSGAVLEAQTAFWRRYLAGAPPVLALPIDRPRGVAIRDAGDGHPFSLSDRLSAGVQRLGRELGATPFMVLLAAFQALLQRHTAQEDLCVGTPVAGRNRIEVEGLIGFLVNTLVLRSDLSGGPTFRSLLSQGRESALQVHAHQDLPFDKLVEDLAPVRSLSHTPLFQVVFVLQNVPQRPAAVPDLDLRPLAPVHRTAKFDLILSLMESGGRFSGALLFASALFDAATIRRMADHFLALLEAVLTDPDHPLATVPLLGAAESGQALLAGCAAAGERAVRELHHLFAEQARRTPEAPAVVQGEERLTYRELDEAANRLAHLLASLGVGPEIRVGICLERGPSLVVAILGVLKAGGTYVPLDPAYPAGRLAFLLEDSAVSLLLSESRLRGILPSTGMRLLLLDEEGARLAGCGSGEPAVRTVPGNGAYVIYTSGSTGRPKGVVVTHANAARLFSATWSSFGFGGDDVWTLFHSVAFDFSVWEIWGALLYGGTLVVVPHEVSRSPRAFHELLRRERVTVLNQTPSAFGELVRVLDDLPGLALRLVIFGGEALDFQSLRPWFERFGGGGPRLVNMFGITETTVHVTAREITAADLDRVTGSGIGAPIEDLRIAILDPAGHPVPEGVAGELYVGGPGLARGYWNRPELTASRFIPDPLRGEPGARLYRSGDLVRRRGADLHYLGRIDQQVKLRGFRIELGEIEAALRGHPEIAAAVCLLRDGDPAGKRLVAYVVPRGAPALGTGELRRWLGKRLPEHMVPSAFVLLAAFPLTVHGKLDRGALPDPQPAKPELEGAFLPPRTPIEEGLAGIWADLLGLDRVGVEDSFFDLGGHSLLATRLLSRVRESFGVDLSLRHLFATPTVASLARAVEAGIRGASLEAWRQIEPRPEGGPVPLAFPQEPFWLFWQTEPASSAYNIAKAIRLIGSLEPAALAASYGEILRRHEILRTRFALQQGRPVQVVGPVEAGMPLIDLAGLPVTGREGEAERLGASDARCPFDLACGRPVRAVLLRLTAGEHVLLLCGHHIVFDAWSLSLFAQELTTLYGAFSVNAPSPLPELPIQYADFAVWQRDALGDEALQAQIRYWNKQLLGAPPLLDLPTDLPRPAVADFRSAVRSTPLPEDLMGQLKTLCNREGVTLYMALLAGFSAMLARYSGLEDLVVSSGIANRTRSETERLIGCFFNLLALRIDLSGDPTFRQILSLVREVILGAYSHQDLPFQRLLQELKVERAPGLVPFAQVFFELNNVPPGLDLPGLQVRSLGVEQGAGNFDLAMFVEQHSDRVAVSLHYATALFLGPTIERLLAEYGHLLAQVVRDPEVPLSRLAVFAGDDGAALARLFTGDLDPGLGAEGAPWGS
jgi:amino acid adenylation domain-containing protein